MAGDAREVPAALRVAYHVRCQEEGVELEVFVGEMRGAHPAADLLALVAEVEADVLENIALMAADRPELEAMAEARTQAIRRQMAALKATLEGDG